MRFTHETAVTVDGTPYSVFAEWSDLSNLPQLLSHVSAATLGDEQDIGSMVVTLAGADIEFVAERTMCSDDTICWQNVGTDFEYVLTATVKPVAKGALVMVNCSFDPPGVLPDFIETLGFHHTFCRELDHDLQRYRQTFERRAYVQGDGPPASAKPAFGMAD